MKKFLLLLPLACLVLCTGLDAAISGARTYFNASQSATATQPIVNQPAFFADMNVANTNSVWVYVQFFDDTTAGTGHTPGTSTPKMVRAIPPGGVLDGSNTASVAFQSGVWIAITTTPTGSGAPAVACSTFLAFQ